MRREDAKRRILRALRSGPLYEGALALVVGQGWAFDRALQELRREGAVERSPDDPMTWRLRP